MTQTEISTVLEELEALNAEGKLDIYTALAAKEFGVEVESVTPEQRASAKKRILQLAYGVRTPALLDEDLNKLMEILVTASPTGRVPLQPQDLMREEERGLPVSLDVDYSEIELRIMAEQGLLPDGVQPMGGSSLYPNAGGGAHVLQPVGIVLESPKDKAMRKVLALGRPRLILLARYRIMPDGNHVQRRRRAALAKRIRRFLPQGITLDMAVSLIGPQG